MAAALMVTGAASHRALAKVEQRSKAGFAISHEAVVAASRKDVWQLLIKPDQWWSADHSYSGDAGNFSMDLRPGGCFCETLNEGDAVEHARIIYVDHEKILRLSGALGPLQSEALTGTWTVTLSPVEQGTHLRFEYVAGGYARFDLKKIAPAVDAVIGEQHERLVRLIETGHAAPAEAGR